MVLLIFQSSTHKHRNICPFKRAGFFSPLQGLQTLAISSKIWMLSKEELDFNYFSQAPTERFTQSGISFKHKSFKLKSSFNPVGPFQLESMFYFIEQDLHRQKYREPRNRNLTKEEYKAIKSLKNNENIISNQLTKVVQ